MNKVLVVFGMLSVTLLTGCVSSEERMAECEKKGISKDTCYLAEQNKESAENAAIMQDNARYWERENAKKKHKK